jgi:hypothetical protein
MNNSHRGDGCKNKKKIDKIVELNKIAHICDINDLLP